MSFFLSIVLLTLAVASADNKEEKLAEISSRVGRRLKLWDENTYNYDSSRARRKRSTCNTCSPATVGNITIDFGEPFDLGLETFSYPVGPDGCSQLNVTCTGYGTVLILISTQYDPQAIVNFAMEDLNTQSVVSTILPCEQYGWGASDSSVSAIDNAFTCQVSSNTPVDETTTTQQPGCTCSQ